MIKGIASHHHKTSTISHKPECQPGIIARTPKTKISISTTKSANHVFNNFIKLYKRALEHFHIGEMLTASQLLDVLSYMGFVEESPSQREQELSKTLTEMLSCDFGDTQGQSKLLSVRRANLFKFLLILCDIQEVKESRSSSFFEEEAQGMAADTPEKSQQPLVVIRIGQFDSTGCWHCTEAESQQIKSIFYSMKMQRVSRLRSRRGCTPQSGHRHPNKEFCQSFLYQGNENRQFQPKLCDKSEGLANKRNKDLRTKLRSRNLEDRVENRLMLRNELHNRKVADELSRSLEKELDKCTFKPKINRRGVGDAASKTRDINERAGINRSMSRKSGMSLSVSYSQEHIDGLLQTGNEYRRKRQQLRELKINLNKSVEMKECTFRPETTKSKPLNSKWAYVRNREKEVERLCEGRKQREFANLMKERGYPAHLNWAKLLNTTKAAQKSISVDLSGDQIRRASTPKRGGQRMADQSRKKNPILVIDLKLLNSQNNVNVYEGDNVRQMSQRISLQNGIPKKLWGRVQELIRNSIEQCQDVFIRSDQIFST